MARMRRKREVIHFAWYDTWARGTAGALLPVAAPPTPATLFEIPRGNRALSNFLGPGTFPGRCLYKLLGIRLPLFFHETRRLGMGSAGSPLDDNYMMQLAMNTIFLKMELSQKTALELPGYYCPTGGGIYGDVGSQTVGVFNHGEPTPRAAMQLAKPVVMAAQQRLTVDLTMNAIGAGNLIVDLVALTMGIVNIQVIHEGVYIREVV